MRKNGVDFEMKKIVMRVWPLLGIVIMACNYSIFKEGNASTKLSFGLAFLVFIALSFYSGMKIETTDRVQMILRYLIVGVSPFFQFLMMETLANNKLSNIDYKYWLGNMIWFTIFIGLAVVLIRRVKYAIIISYLIAYVVGLTNYYVTKFRGVPILPWDIKSASTAAEVAGAYDYSLSIYTIWATIILFVFITSALKLKNERILIRNKKSIIILSEFTAAFVIVMVIQSTMGVLGMFGGTVFAWRQNVQYQVSGTVLSFMENMRFLDIAKPSGYSVEEIKTMAKRYSDVKDETNKNTIKPNIIGIMNESFSDLAVVKDLHTNEDYMPFIHGLTENTIKGHMNVSVFGGNTCNTEFEFLTGSTLAFLPTGSIPYQQYIDRDSSSLCRILEKQGYVCNAIHPSEPTNWNRSKVYPLLGFEKFLSIQDFNSPTYIRGYVSDKSSFDKVIDEFNSRDKSKPLFLFNVTMQNHGGYTTYELPKTIHFPDEEKYNGTSIYLNLIQKTDSAFEQLIEYFKTVKEPTIIVMFGDHQPGIYDGFYDDINAQTDLSTYRKKYEVPFLIWANYNIKEEAVDDISANYLSSLLLQTAGLQMTPYNKYLLEARKKVPAISANGYEDSKGNWHVISEKSEDYDYVNQLQKLQYNNLFDPNNKVSAMYDLQNENN